MSKMSELATVVSELKQCGECLVKISDELAEIFSSGEEPKKEPEKKKAAKKTEEPKAAEPVKKLSFTDVRTILAEKSRDGHMAEIKAILTKHGADKLSEIKPEDYAALVAKWRCCDGSTRIVIGVLQSQMVGMPAVSEVMRGS